MTTAQINKNNLSPIGEFVIDDVAGTDTEPGSIDIFLTVGPEDATRSQWMRLQECSGAFDFWNDPGEDIYTEADGEPV